MGSPFGRDGSWIGSTSAVAGSSLGGAGASWRGARSRSLNLSCSSDRGSREIRPNACNLKNCRQVGPIRAWRRAEAALAKHRGDRRGGDIDPELQQFASDPEVAPPRVLPPEAKDQTLDSGVFWRPRRYWMPLG